MKFIIKSTVLALAVASSAAAFADTGDGTVHFTGKIMEDACTIKTKDIAVTLPTVAPGDFGGAAGSVQGTKHFDIELTNCDGSKATKVQARFSGTADAYGSGKVLKNGGDATGVGILVTDPGLTTESDGYSFTDVNNWTSDVAIPAGANGAVNIPFEAHYVSTSATVETGTVDATATFYLQYN
ncbi:fimbrial protein [Pseudocitrobacter cyperus]|uniref:Fimbrial protein n=1 Tax=Pseudocitrobacter cyperus TaxID=3112843 RepID=A0ABV0HHY9_9ENTR